MTNNEKTFPGNDLHSRMCEWVYATADYYDLMDACNDGETPEELTYNMTDSELASAIEYTLDNSLDGIWYIYKDDDPATSTAKEDGIALLNEYKNLSK